MSKLSTVLVRGFLVAWFAVVFISSIMILRASRITSKLVWLKIWTKLSKMFAPADDDTLEKRVQQLLRDGRLRRASLVAPLTIPLLNLSSFSAWSRMISWLWNDVDSLNVRSLFVQTASLSVFVALYTYFLFLVRPRAVTHRNINIFQAIIIIVFVIQLPLHSNKVIFISNHSWMIGARGWLAFAHGDLSSTIILNVLFACASTISYSYLFGANSRFFFESITSIFICLMVYLLDDARKAEIRATLQAKSSSNFEATVTSLLSGICDAVVHLSDDFQISRASPQLSGLLLKSRSLQGCDFTALLRPEDREPFRLMASRRSEVTQVQHACLVDTNDTRVRTQLFHATGRDVDDVAFHIIGIKEEGDEEQRIDVVGDGHPNHHIQPLDWSTSSSGLISIDADSSVGEDKALVWVKTFDHNLEIKKCTASFTSFFGPAHNGQGLLDLVLDRHNQKFKKWWVTSTNSMLNGETPRPINVCFRYPRISDGLYQRADVTLACLTTETMEEEEVVELEDSSMICMLSFSNIQTMRAKHRTTCDGLSSNLHSL